MYKKVLIPVAFDHGQRAYEAVKVARLLADDDAEVTLLNVLEDLPPYVSVEIPTEVFENARKEVEVKLKQIVTETGGRAHAVVVEGHAGASIVSYAESHGVDCIVLASHRPELLDYFLGSTAARVVRHAPCAVHVLR